MKPRKYDPRTLAIIGLGIVVLTLSALERPPRTLNAALEAVPGAPVKVALFDDRIEMPTRLVPGPTTFDIINRGDQSHSFQIRGNAADFKLDGNLVSNASGTLEATLEPGVYEARCPESNHADRGMKLQITVTPSP